MKNELCRDQDQVECSEFLSPTRTISVKGKLDDVFFQLIVSQTLKRVMRIVSPPSVCDDEITDPLT
jgi:hypothetical protein